MKLISAIVLFFFFISGTSGKERTLVGSTPAAPVVRSFLGIPLTDSIDFIRWKLTLLDSSYSLTCNFGIGKPNTNGFMNGGKKISLTGRLTKQKHYYQLHKGQKTLGLAELNPDLFHFTDAGNSLLVGNSGWSYTLGNITPSGSDAINTTTTQTALKDSMAFAGRSPCKIPGIIAAGESCYKLKWFIVLYANAQKNIPGTYKVIATPYRKEGRITGKWEIIKGKEGRILYQLNNDKGKGFLYLLKVDEHILAFADAQGKMLVGDEDFSYTLNAAF